jgi:Protein of unknown function (DUF2795)
MSRIGDSTHNGSPIGSLDRGSTGRRKAGNGMAMNLDRVSQHELDRHLGAVNFPLRRDELARLVRDQGARDDVVEAMWQLPNRWYEDLKSALAAFAV